MKSNNSQSEDRLMQELKALMGREILIITEAPQLNLLGQTFRPIFCGTIAEVGRGHITLDPVIFKMVNAPFYEFPMPISIPFEKVVTFTTEIPCDTVFPLT
ncbi:hypothetical protein V1502_09805 [Bacillus sp. SCS-153A]|uniref:hypothetical protein n=1 Tax=Rossellomorea sedimentorum TaxID=3115294 RepID=UPI003905E520